MKRNLAWLLSLVLVLSAFTGCASEQAYIPTGDGLSDYTRPSQGETMPYMTAPGGLHNANGFTLAYYPDAGFNPYTCANIHNRMIFSLLYQSLFTVSSDYTVEPQLCSRYTVTEDLRTHVFSLAEATFDDGTLVNAMDVAESLKAAEDSDYYSGRFAHIDSIKANDDNTVTIVTKEPMDSLPLLLNIPVVKYGQADAKQPQGTGPYVLTTEGRDLSLQRRENWWCDVDVPLTAETIRLTVGESATQIRDAFEFGSVGISTADPGAADYAAYRSDYELWNAESGVFLYLTCKSSSVFSNAKIRAALTRAIDRTAILTECYNGFGATAVLPASPHSPVYDRNLAKTITYEPIIFSQALTDAGLVGRTVRLLVLKTDSIRVQAARKIAKMLTDCGLVVELLEHDYTDYRAVLRDGSFDLHLGQTRLSPNMDLSEFFRKDGNLSYGGLASDTCYSMCLEALENSGNFYNLHQMVLRNAQLIPILFRSHAVCAERGTTENMNPSRDNIFYYSMGRELESIRSVMETPSESEE